MIRLETDLAEFANDIGEMIRAFLGQVEISPDEGERVFVHSHREDDGVWTETCRMDGREAVWRAPAVSGGLEEKRQKKRAVKTACFLVMRDVTGGAPAWGSLTGIRPTRVLRELMDEGLPLARAQAEMARRFYVDDDKAALCGEIVTAQEGRLYPAPDEYDVYIGIPFCVTRCSYCAFAADVLGDGHMTGPYLDALLREMEAGSALVAGKRPRAVYVGGGTSTALSADQLGRLMDGIERIFPGCRELTVEAGRPDTITKEKLAAIARATRISVNPQSFSDETLRRIGRAHTAEDTLRSYDMARSAGFGDINMDLIAALPGEGLEDFRRTLEKVESLGPESVTVHTLAIKRSSRLHEEGYVQAPAQVASAMVDEARSSLGLAGYRPYYLYRQKYMAGNLENVGYAKPGYECLYNIGNMEETAPVLAFGAGSISKWLFQRERRIERAPNVRNVAEYIARVDEMVQRKRALIEEDGR